MKCPHCGTGIHLWKENCEITTEQEQVGDPIVNLEVGFCPECNQPIIDMDYGFLFESFRGGEYKYRIARTERIYPVDTCVPTLDEYIPSQYKDNFYEAYRVLSISPKASATLSRYLLQMVLHEELGIKKRNLEEEINELESKDLVSATLVKLLQVFRKVANFGAHPKKSTHTNEIIEIEHGEAEIMLDLLEEMFECIFVKPKQHEAFLKDIKEKYGIDV